MSSDWRYYVAVSIMLAGFTVIVLPFLMLFVVVGWIWCCAKDGFQIAAMTYEQYKDLFNLMHGLRK